MYLFTRRGRLTRGVQGVLWATTIRDHVSQIIGNEVGLWSTAYSPAAGTMTWTTWWSDLATLETAMRRLTADQRYVELVVEGIEYMPMGVDDALYQSLYMTEGDMSSMNVVGTVSAVTAIGKSVEAVTSGITIAQKFESITGQPSGFHVNVTGNYGGVGWLSAYADLAAFEAANNKVAADESWLEYLDSLTCYGTDVSANQATLYQKIP
jgi:hypothetical protein